MSCQEQSTSGVDFANKFKGMSPEKQVLFICRLAHQLTICARSTYIPETEEITDASMLRWLNETQHVLLGQSCNILDNDSHRYSDESFCEILLSRTNHTLYGVTLSKIIKQVLNKS